MHVWKLSEHPAHLDAAAAIGRATKTKFLRIFDLERHAIAMVPAVERIR
jgi:hypothetical protein